MKGIERRKGFVLTPSSRVQSITSGKFWQQTPEAAGHRQPAGPIINTVRKDHHTQLASPRNGTTHLKVNSPTSVNWS